MTASLRRWSGALLLACLIPTAFATLRAQSPADTLLALANRASLFRSNAGQWRNDVLFRTEAHGATVSFLHDGFSVAAVRSGTRGQNGDASAMRTSALQQQMFVWNVGFKGALSSVALVPELEQGQSATYFQGTAATSLAHHPVDYSALRYRGVYHNVDILFHTGGAGQLKYDCIVHPGGRAEDVAMELKGVEGLRVERNGTLTVTTAWGEVQEEAPYAYQIVEGVKREVEVEYVLLDHTTYGFRVVGEYDPAHELVIDPVILAWSTFVGGITTDGYVYEIALDSVGNVYVVGFNHHDFPTTPTAYARSERQEPDERYDAVIFKLSSDGRRLLASTYIGASDTSDYATDIAIAPSGDVWVCGYTGGSDFPTTTPAPSWRYTRNAQWRIFLLRLDANLSSLRYSAIVGANDDYSNAQGAQGSSDRPRIELAANGDVVLASTVTAAVNAPAGTPTFNATKQGGQDMLLCRISSDGSRIVYAGYLGGRSDERCTDLTLGPNDDPYIVGSTESSDIATTTGAYRTTFPTNRSTCGIVAHVAADGRSLLYSTLFPDVPLAVAVYPTGEAVVGGSTTYNRYDLPLTAGVFDTQYNNTQEGFVAKFSADGRALRFCTLIGDRAAETVEDIILQPSQIILAVRVYQGTFPEISCTGTRTVTVPYRDYDFFVCCIAPDASQFRLSIPFSGEDHDYVGHMQMLEESQELVIGLATHSNDFPTTAGSYQTTKLNARTGEDQMVVIKLKPTITPNFSVSVDTCGTANFTDLTTDDCMWGVPNWRPSSWRWEFGDGTTSSQPNTSHVYAKPGQYKVKLVVGSPADSLTRTVVVPPFVSSTIINAHISRALFAGGGNNIVVPIMLDNDPAAVGVTSLALTLRYDTLMAHPIGLDSTGIDSLFRGTLLEHWRLVEMDTLPGALTLRFVADTAGRVLTGPGTLLRVQFATFISTHRYLDVDSSLASELPFDLVAPGRCAGAATSPGLLHLTVCGLQYRLIEMVGGNKYAREPAGPNPFSSFTAIPFSLGLDGPTRLEVRDVSGRLVATLVDQYLAAGSYRVVWDARGMGAGVWVYFFRLVSGDWSRTGTLHLVR